MKVRDLMRAPVVSVERGDDLALALQLMAWNGLRHLPVLHNGRLVGILSERDLLARRGRAGHPSFGKVDSAMSPEPETIEPQVDLEEASARLVVNKHGCLPVLDGDELIGILTATDLLAEMAQVRLEPGAAGSLLDRDVESIMTAHVMAVYEDDPLMEGAARMHQYGIRHLPVIDGLDRVVGILSERDVLESVGDLRHAAEDPTARIGALRIRDAMTREPRTVQRGSPVAEVVGTLAQERFGALPVVDDEGRLQGIVSYVDILRAMRQVS